MDIYSLRLEVGGRGGRGTNTAHPPISVPGQAAPYDAASRASPRCKVLTSAGCCQVLESSFLVSLQTRSRLPPCHSARLSPQHVGVQNPGLMPIGLPVWVSLKGGSHTAHGAFTTKAKVFVMSGARFGPVYSVPLRAPPSAGTASFPHISHPSSQLCFRRRHWDPWGLSNGSETVPLGPKQLEIQRQVAC